MFQKNRIFLSLIPVLCGAALFLGGQAPDVSGIWSLRVSNNDGTYRTTYLKLRQSGESVTGSVINNYREMPISDGTVKDGKLHFVVGNLPRQRSFDGSVEGDRLTLQVKASDGKILDVGTAERSTDQALAPPAPLPPPALHDVPDNGLARTPPMGWNSWNHFARRIDDKTVREIADAMVASGMKDAGYIYVNIDDAWQGSRDSAGNIQPNTKFPDMKALADYVHSKGLKIGIYSSPGPTTCAAYEGSFGHEQQDANTYAKWGIDYLKYDWCSAGAIYKDSDMQPIYQKMGDALKATGRPIVYSLCQYGRSDVWKWGAKVGGNLWRTTGDISDHWKSMESIGFRQLEIAPFATIGHWNDPDMLEVGNGGMTDDEYRTHMSMWAMLRAPLLAGNDLRNMSDATKAILMNRDVIAIDQDRSGKPARLLKKQGDTEIWIRPLSNGANAVAFFNRGDQQANVNLDWSDIGDKQPKKGRDVWQHSDFKRSGSYSVSVPVHGTVLLWLK
jgi:alpha-galactosidase